jgi:death on curing protein
MPAYQYLGGEYGKGLLESALFQPQQTWNGCFQYRTVYDKAAILLYAMIKNHPFIDGNKRMALTTTTVFLTLNLCMFCASTDESVDCCLTVARSEITDWRVISKWIRSRSINVARFNRMGEVQRESFLQQVEESLGSTTVTRSLDYTQRLFQLFRDLFANP